MMKWFLSFLITMAVSTTVCGTTFTKIVDTNTAIPGGNGNFTELPAFDTPAIDNGKIVFRGLGLDLSSDQTDGIYTTLYGGLDVIADTSTLIPDGGGDTFDTSGVHGFGTPSISGSNIAFKGDSDGAADRGVYAKFGGNPLETILDTRGSSLFTTLSSPAISGDNIGYWTFLPYSDYFDGIYEHTGGAGGVSSKVADEGDIVYGKNSPTRYFNEFYSSGVDQDGTETAFIAKDTTGRHGLYSTITFGTLFTYSLRVYTDDTAMPGSPGEFFDLKFTTSVSFDGGDIVFRGQNTSFSINGIYFYDTVAYALSLIADVNTTVPGGSGNFSSFSSAAVDGPTDNVVFLANDTGGTTGLYGRIGGVMGEIISVGDSLDGKVIDGIHFGHEGLDGAQAAFRVSFTDSSQAIYIADIAFAATNPADFDGDGSVNLKDYAIFAAAFLSTPADSNWNATCDISDPPDNVIDLADFKKFVAKWIQ